MFRVRDAVYAIDNYDPASGANVLSRGIVGDIGRRNGGGLADLQAALQPDHRPLPRRAAISVPVYLARVLDGADLGARRSRSLQPHRASQAAPGRHRQRHGRHAHGRGAARAAPQAYDITVFGAEPHGNYNRMLLSPLLAGDKRIEEIVTHPPEWYAEHGITLHRARSGGADRSRARRVRSRPRRRSRPTTGCLIATGSVPIMLADPGKRSAGRHHIPRSAGCRCHAGSSRAPSARGRDRRRPAGSRGGQRACSDADMDVTVVHLHRHLMERQLDAQAAELLRDELERRGLKFMMPAKTSRLFGETRVTGVGLATAASCRPIWWSWPIGVRPNIELATDGRPAVRARHPGGRHAADLRSGIYAVGECVQHRGKTFGLVAPLWEQARVCATYLAERGTRRYRGITAVDAAEGQPASVYFRRRLRPGPGSRVPGAAGSETRHLQAPGDRARQDARRRAVRRHPRRRLVLRSDQRGPDIRRHCATSCCSAAPSQRRA